MPYGIVYFSAKGLTVKVPVRRVRHRRYDIHDIAAERELALTHSLAELPVPPVTSEGPAHPSPGLQCMAFARLFGAATPSNRTRPRRSAVPCAAPPRQH